MDKEALIIIPGLDSKEVGFALKRVVKKIEQRQQIAHVNILDKESEQKQRIELTFKHTNKKKILDVYEVFWGDIINENDSNDLPIWKKAIFGMELITFWFFSSIWKGASKNKLLFCSVALSGLLILGWYVSILGMLVTSLYSSDTLSDLLQLGVTPKYLSGISFSLGLVLGVFPMSLLLKVSGFSMKFIKSPSLRENISNRINALTDSIINDGSYDRITFFSHSLGTIPTLDFLAGFKKDASVNIRSIMIGAVVSFFANKSSKIKEDINRCAKNGSVDEWTDYFSKEDYMCAYETIDEYGENFNSIKLDMDSSWLTRLSKKIHVQYFDESRIIEKLISD